MYLIYNIFIIICSSFNQIRIRECVKHIVFLTELHLLKQKIYVTRPNILRYLATWNSINQLKVPYHGVFNHQTQEASAECEQSSCKSSLPWPHSWSTRNQFLLFATKVGHVAQQHILGHPQTKCNFFIEFVACISTEDLSICIRCLKKSKTWKNDYQQCFSYFPDACLPCPYCI